MQVPSSGPFGVSKQLSQVSPTLSSSRSSWLSLFGTSGQLSQGSPRPSLSYLSGHSLYWGNCHDKKEPVIIDVRIRDAASANAGIGFGPIVRARIHAVCCAVSIGIGIRYSATALPGDKLVGIIRAVVACVTAVGIYAIRRPNAVAVPVCLIRARNTPAIVTTITKWVAIPVSLIGI